MDPTTGTLRRAPAQDLGDSLRSPSVQKFLGRDFGAGSPQQPPPLRHKDGALPGGLYSSEGGIAAYQPAAPPPTMGDSLAADYRSQLQQYAQQLAAKSGEAAALRQQAAELKQQLAAAEARASHAGQQVARNASAAGQLEAATAALESALQEREAEVQAAAQAKRAAEQAAAAARAQAAAALKSVAAKAAEHEQDRRFFKEQLEAKDSELHSLEDVLRKQAAELERQSREWVAREAEVSAGRSRSAGAAAGTAAELAVAQGKVEAAAKRVRALEGENGELRRQRAQGAADQRMLEELLGDSEAERRELHDKYVRLGEKLEGLIKEGKLLKSSASAEAGASRTAVQEALKDAEAALKERAGLKAQAHQLQMRLEEEQGRRAQLKESAQRKLAAAEQEVAALRGDMEGKARQLQGLQADMKALQADAESRLGACEKQLAACQDRVVALKQEAEAERQRASKAAAVAEELHGERLRLELQQQALRYERRIQELEAHAVQGGGGAGMLRPGSPGVRGSVLDYIPRGEHVRLLEARLAAKEGDLQLEMSSRVAQAEREAQWKLETKEQEIGSLTARTRQLEDELHGERQRASSQAHALGEEAKRAAAQCVELQRELAARDKEVTRLKETLKDARTATADMDDDAMSSGRQVARLRHALDGSQAALKAAQEDLAQELKRCEEAQREAAAHAVAAADAERRGERLAGEVWELEAALEQKQELVAALQAECDALGAKLMAHREVHQQEVEGQRRQLRQEWEAQVDVLEQRCLGGEALLRQARRAHEEALCQLGQQHVEQVGQLESQLAAAERCNAELKELTAALGSVRQEDVEALKDAVQELQGRLREAVRERDRLQRQHREQLAALAGQVRAKMGALRGQQAQLRQSTEADVSAAFAECLASYEAGLGALQQRLEQQTAAADSRQAELGARLSRLGDGMQRLLAALRSAVPQLPEAALQALLGAGRDAGADTGTQLESAVQQVAQAVQQHVEQAEAAAIESALAAVEAEVLPGGSSGGSPASPSRLLSPRKRQQAAAAAAGAAAAAAGPSLEANEGRLARLLGRSQELLAQVAAGDAQVACLRQQVAALEAALSSHQDKFGQAKGEAVQAAEAARAAAVAPLQAEVARLTERVEGLQQLHASELASIEAQAQATIGRMAAGSASLQAQLRDEGERAEGLAADLARAQAELAQHTQRAASTIDVQHRELDLLKGRIREVEARDASSQQELRALRQREREAGGGARQL